MPSSESPGCRSRLAAAPTSAFQAIGAMLAVPSQHGFADGQRRLDAGQVVRAVEREVRAGAHLEVAHLLVHARGRRCARRRTRRAPPGRCSSRPPRRRSRIPPSSSSRKISASVGHGGGRRVHAALADLQVGRRWPARPSRSSPWSRRRSCTASSGSCAWRRPPRPASPGSPPGPSGCSCPCRRRRPRRRGRGRTRREPWPRRARRRGRRCRPCPWRGPRAVSS